MKRFVKILYSAAIIPCLITIATSTYAAANTNNPVNPAEKAKIEEVVHQYLIAKPEVILEAMQVLQNKQIEQTKQAVQKTQLDAPHFAPQLFHQTNDPLAGKTDGKITIVEFFDYQCPHCVDMAPILDAIIKANPEVRVVFKEWPIRGATSEFASRAAIAANKQGKYMEFNHAVLTAPQPLTQDSILAIAQKIGLNVEQLKTDMKDANIDNQLKANMKLAQDLKLLGTPALFIGQTNEKQATIAYVPGEMTQVQLQEAIDKQGK